MPLSVRSPYFKSRMSLNDSSYEPVSSIEKLFQRRIEKITSRNKQKTNTSQHSIVNRFFDDKVTFRKANVQVSVVSSLKNKKLVLFYLSDSRHCEEYTEYLQLFYKKALEQYGSYILEVVELDLSSDDDSFQLSRHPHEPSLDDSISIDDLQVSDSEGEDSLLVSPKSPWIQIPKSSYKAQHKILDQLELSDEEQTPKLIVVALQGNSDIIRSISGPSTLEVEELESQTLLNKWIQELYPTKDHKPIPWTKDCITRRKLLVKNKITKESDPLKLNILTLLPERVFGKTRTGKNTVQVLSNKKVVGLLWTSSWSSNCTEFVDRLSKFYSIVKEKYGPDLFEIVLLDSERDEAHLYHYMKQKNMNWLTVSSHENKTKVRLQKLFKVESMPKLVLLDLKQGTYLEGITANNQQLLDNTSLAREWEFSFRI
jgi:hypothetical protein